MDAAYYRSWRARHPEYRRREVERQRRKRAQGRGDRTAEYQRRNAARRAARAVLEPLGPLHQGHPVFDQARAIVGPRTGSLVTLHDPLHDDLVSVATLAILEGTDPHQAVDTYRTREVRWGRITCPILEGTA